MKVMVVYDGTLHAKTALQYGVEKVKENGGNLLVLHVFNSNMFFDYDAIPGAIDIARRESSRSVEEAEKIIKEMGKGIKASIILEEGNPEKKIMQCAKDENVDLLLCPTRYKAVARSFRRMLDEKAIETSIYAYGVSPLSTIHTTR